MLVGVPKEVKTRENRVGMVPGGVKALVTKGHKVIVQKGAGLGVGIHDDEYTAAGASIISQAEEIWSQAEMIVKVKEPISQEYPLMRSGQILYTYLHLAAVPELAHVLLDRKVTGIAYETVQMADGSLPLLRPMSEVAGRIAVQAGAHCLEKAVGGKGLLLGGVPGVKPGHVVILGGGAAGVNAAKMAVGLGARVSVLDIDAARLAYLDDVFGNKLTTLMSNPDNIARSVKDADLVIGTVLITGDRAPVLVTADMIRSMEPGSAVVDVSIDQGGCIATIRPTTHDNPTYVEHDVIHYGVTNMPGTVPRTSTYALTNVTLKYAMELADKGLEKALAQSKALTLGLNTYQGKMTHPTVAKALGLHYEAPPFA